MMCADFHLSCAFSVVRLPSINCGVLLRESRKEQFSKIVVSVQLNSDAYNKGWDGELVSAVAAKALLVDECE